MSEIFFSPSSLACYPADMRPDYELAGTWPVDAASITQEEFQEFFLSTPAAGIKIGSANGKPAWINDEGYISALELGWVQNELARAELEINKAQDSDPTATGTEADWRAYRVALRAWPQAADFPNKSSRPIAPDA